MARSLIAPTGTEEMYKKLYINNIRKTISTYLPTFIFVGEALQNAMDEVRRSGGAAKKITVEMDFDERRVTVRDEGSGFPDRPDLLYLGGGDKQGLGLAGEVGVGLKVIIFSSNSFALRATGAQKSVRLDLVDAYKYGDPTPPPLELPDDDCLPADPSPLFASGTGTEVSYTFPPGVDGVPEKYLRDVYDECLATTPSFEDSLANAVARGKYPTRLAALIASDLRRFMYVGSTMDRPEFANLEIDVTVKGHPENLGALADYADAQLSASFKVAPKYFTVRDSLDWATAPKPVVSGNALGDGGTNLTKTSLGFNVTKYTTAEEFESLLTNARGQVSPELNDLKRLLFPKLNSVTLTIGRIPQFQKFLPGAARRVISARGVVTQHDIDVSSGQNQQYVRCFDIVVDVDADLNWGKTQLTDMHLVSNVRKFVNEAYRSSIQGAAKNYVGVVKDRHQEQVPFWSREDLGVPSLIARKVPRDENDVIALFFELAGKGHLNSFACYGLSQSDTYDGRAAIRRASDDESVLTQTKETDLKVIEFKLRGASIARDFDVESKRIEGVDLVICYDVGDSNVATHQVVEWSSSKLNQNGVEPYPDVTHVLFDTVSGQEVQILPLRALVARLMPPEPPSLPPDAVDAED